MSRNPTSTNRAASPSRTHRGKPVLRFLSAHWPVLALIVVAAIFVAQNGHEVSIDLFSANLTSPMWLVLLINIVVGVLIGMLIARHRRRR